LETKDAEQLYLCRILAPPVQELEAYGTYPHTEALQITEC